MTTPEDGHLNTANSDLDKLIAASMDLQQRLEQLDRYLADDGEIHTNALHSARWAALHIVEKSQSIGKNLRALDQIAKGAAA